MDWLAENTQKGTDDDFVSLNDLKELYDTEISYSRKKLSQKEFMAVSKAFFIGRWFSLKERPQFYEKQTQKADPKCCFDVKIKRQINLWIKIISFLINQSFKKCVLELTIF